jgi:hypothetical protein
MSHLAALVRVPVDASVFREVYAQRVRRTVGYLLLLVALSTAAFGGRVALGVHRLVEELLPEVDKIPTVTIRDGKASANVEQPWTQRIGEERGKQVMLIIDTTGKLGGFADDQCGFFLKERSVLVKSPEGEEREVPLDRVPDMVVGPTAVKAWLAKARWQVPLAVAAVAFLWFSFAKTMQALLLILVALLVTAGRRKPLGFGQLFTLCVYALTAPVIADCVTWFFPLPAFLMIYTALAVGYTITAARRIPDDPQLTLV